MSNDNREEIKEMHPHGKETVGALLHRERVTRRISIQRVAEDLKFNEEYLVAIEESRYNDLPAIPYVRVYIRTIAKYLSLDGEELLDRFSQEIHMDFPDPEKERHDTMRISIQREKKRTNWIGPVVGGIVVLAILVYFISTRSSNIENEENQIDPTTDTTQVDSAKGLQTPVIDTIDTTASAIEVNTVKEVQQEVVTNIATPEVEAVDTARDSVSALTASHVEKEGDEQIKTLSYPLDSLFVTISVSSDSSFVQVIKDRRKVFNSVMSTGVNKSFSASSPIYVKVGRNSVLSYAINGVPVSVEGDWMTFIKFSKENGAQRSNQAEWNAAR